jgi:ferritin-like metal-binding protein YciE
MAAVTSLHTHLVDEIADLRDAEEQLTQALPMLAQMATSKPLRTAFRSHLKETRGHIRRLNQALRELGEKPQSKSCKGMQGLLYEANSVIGQTPEGPLRDAVMITGAQKVEHYEMASYGTARTYAQVLGQTGVARLLAQTLREEKSADRKLTQIAKAEVNDEAAEEWQAQNDGGLADWAGTAAQSASRGVAKTVRQVASAVGAGKRRSSGGKKRSSSRKRGGSGGGGRVQKKRRG